jgi:membrane peptidoglycan carboxypeptidase
MSAIAGVLVTAMVTPALAVTSLTAKSTIGVFQNLPEFITIGEQSQQNVIYANKDGAPVPIATTYKQNRKEVAWKDVSPFLKNAAVDGEDRRFYTHGGVDVQSVARAVVKNNTESSNGTSGGSTLDMQLVKNILVNEAATDPKLSDDERTAAVKEAIETTPVRKLKEMKLAIGLDKKYTKKQILLGYLNIVGMGANTYGVETAAEQYYGVSAKDVTLPQAASLIAIVQQPNAQNLSDPKKYPANKLRRDQILNAMLAMKHITQKEHDDAVATPIESYVSIHAPSSGCRNATFAKSACDYVSKLITGDPIAETRAAAEAEAKANKLSDAAVKKAGDDGATLAEANMAPVVEALGATPEERKANWDKGGYQIYTSIDLGLQDVAQTALNTWAPPTETRFNLGAAADTVEGGTGRILVMAQNKVFDDAGIVAGAAVDPTKTALNLSADHPYGNSNGFETGSTYKVFDLANWLENGHGLGDLVNGRGPQTYPPSAFKAPCDPGAIPGGPYVLRNDGNSGGSIMTVKQALIGSVNNAFMNMATRSDLCSIRDTAKSMGAHRADFKTDLTVNPSAILGSNEQAPLTMAGAVATVGAGGMHCAPIIVDKVIDPSGKELPGQTKACNQALTPEVAAGVADAMIGSMTGGTSSTGNPRDGVPIGGKTGTSPNSHQDWIMGTTTKVGTAVWTGNITGKAPLRSFSNPITHSNYYTTSRFNILKSVMKAANTNAALRGAAFPKPSAAMIGGESATVPSVAGQTPAQAKALLESLNYVYADGGPVASALPVGRVASTDPAAGSKTPVGATITVYTSDGSLATTVPDVVGQNRHNATDALQAAGFAGSNISVEWTASNPGDACKVIAQNPGSGQSAAKTDPVTLKIGTGIPSGPGSTDPLVTCNP